MYRDREAELEVAELDRSTIAVVAGRNRGPGAPLGGGPVFTSAFRAGGGIDYARDGNPTWEALESALGTLDGGVSVTYGSGMAAAAAVLAELAPGARVAVAATAYLEVRRLLVARAEAGSIEVELIDSTDTAAVLATVRGGHMDMLWIDALANPGLDVPELDLIGAAASASDTTLVVDSTLATPMLIRPLELGADVVVHSATKYIGGHSDLLLGVATARDPAAAERLRLQRTMLGAVPGTMEAWLALRGLRTLPLRLERGSESAGTLAGRLLAHPRVDGVRYPGLGSDPAHDVASRLLDGYGAVVSFEVADADAAERVLAGVRLMTPAGSLGGVETLIERQGRWHGDREVPDGLLRLSVGCEHPEDLWRDLNAALDAS